MINFLKKLKNNNVLNKILKDNYFDYSKAVNLFIDGINKNNSIVTPFNYAVIAGSMDVVKYYLFEEKIDIMKEKYDPLILAAASNQVEIGKLFIDKIKDVNYANNKKHTLLMIAITNHSREFIDFLHHHPDIDINCKDNVFYFIIFDRIILFILMELLNRNIFI